MGCQQTCQSKPLLVLEETYTNSEEYTYSSNSMRESSRLMQMKKQNYHKNHNNLKSGNSTLLEFIKQKESIHKKDALIISNKKKSKDNVVCDEYDQLEKPKFFNSFCCTRNQPTSQSDNLSFRDQTHKVNNQNKEKSDAQNIQKLIKGKQSKQKATTSPSIQVEDVHQNQNHPRAKLLFDKNNIQLLNQNNLQANPLDFEDQSKLFYKVNKNSDRSSLMANKRASFNMRLNREGNTGNPYKPLLHQKLSMPRKTTTPFMFQQYEQFNVLLNKLNYDEDLQNRNFKPIEFKYKQNDGSKQQSSSSSSGNQGGSIKNSDSVRSQFENEQSDREDQQSCIKINSQGSSESSSPKHNHVDTNFKKSTFANQQRQKSAKRAVQEHYQKSQEQDQEPMQYNHQEESKKKKDSAEKILEANKKSIGLILNELQKQVDQTIESKKRGSKDMSNANERSRDFISSSNRQINSSSNRNGPTVEIIQQEVTKIKKYYYDSPKSNQNQSQDSPSIRNIDKPVIVIGNINSELRQSIAEQTFKRDQMKSDINVSNLNGPSLNLERGQSRRRKKGKGKKKEKVIETTKTTQLLFHTGMMGQLNNKNSNTIDINYQDVMPDAILDNTIEENKNDQYDDSSPLQQQRSNNRKKSPRKQNKKSKEQKRGKTHLNLPAQLNLKKEKSMNVQRNIKSNVLEDTDPHFKEFQNKWQQRQYDNTYNREFRSVILNKQNSVSDASNQNSPKRMTLSKQLFINEGRGKIEQKYDFLETIGQGGFGLVRKVRHKITGEIRAMKIIQVDQYDQSTLKNLSNEVEILKQLDHPNIVKIYEFYQDKKNLYLIQEFIAGGDLFEKLKNSKGGFEENTAALIMKQVLSAVFYCHKNGVVHRDLKPENILLEDGNNFNNIKVIDFGTSRNFEGTKKMNQKFGTAYYIAPEVLKKNYDEKCDIWSCGVILHIMLCGYPPFRGKNEKEILEKVEVGYFSLSGPEWKAVSREAKLLLKQMLSYVPKDRITAEQSLNSTWIQIQSKVEIVTLREAQNALKALRNFNIDIKLQQAACLYIASQLLTRQELIKFKDIFNCFDINGDGIITLDELKELLTQHLNLSKDRSNKEAYRILQNLDINQNGAVDFTEFVIAIVSTKDILTDDKLLNAFNMLDMDGNGRITKEDLQQVFKGSPEINQDQMLDEMIQEADEKGEGEIAFQEFKKLMLLMQKQGPTQESNNLVGTYQQMQSESIIL
eukprot:403353126